MPFYQYECKCGIKDHKRSIADRDVPEKCDKCGNNKVRLLSAPPLLYSASSRDVKATDQTSNAG